MTGETEVTTPPAPHWECPTPGLDLANIEWRAHEVHPDTPYDDEPSETVPPGWYATGRADDADYFEAATYVIKVQHATDEHGCDVTALLAQYVAATLTLAADAERERRLSRRSRLRRAAKDIATLIGEAVGR